MSKPVKDSANDALKRAFRYRKTFEDDSHHYCEKAMPKEGANGALKRSFGYRGTFERDRAAEATNAVNALRLYIEAGLNQVAFVIDATWSMDEQVDRMRKCIVKVADNIEKTYCADCSFAVVAYRDHSDGDQRIESTFSFGPSHEVASFLSTLKAHGGDDGPEDCFGGLMAAVDKLPWESPQRLLIWIGDAPQHGRQYHTHHDNYPGGCPLGVTGEAVGRALVAKNIQCLFLQVNDNTKQMITLLTKEFASVGAKLSTQSMTSAAESLLLSIGNSVSSTSVGSFASDGVTPNKKHPRDAVVNPDAVIPPHPYACSVVVYTMRAGLDLPGGVHPLVNLITAFPQIHEQQNAELHIAYAPFAEGEFRFAYRARLLNLEHLASWHGITEKVAKCPRWVGYKLNRGPAHIQMCAIFLAREFSIRLTQRDDGTGMHMPIEYVPAQMMAHHGEEWLVEPYLTGEFLKFNNNNGAIRDAATYPEPQAFSHFTHHYSQGRVMVTDVQGVVGDTCYMCTDPAVHTASTAEVLPDSTNLGIAGMVAFYKTHQCNDVCKLLGLPEVPHENKKELEEFVKKRALEKESIANVLADHSQV